VILTADLGVLGRRGESAGFDRVESGSVRFVAFSGELLEARWGQGIRLTSTRSLNTCGW
jgi:hypothetical protein